MTRTIEVESRYQIDDPSLQFDLDFKPGKRIIDTYLDTSEGLLYKQGIFIRNRNGKTIDFKFNMETLVDSDAKNDHTHCDEYSFEVPFISEDEEKFKNICALLKLKSPEIFVYDNFLKENFFTDLVVVDKQRMHANKDGFGVSLDDVKGAGRFIEIEKVVEVESDEVDLEEKLGPVKQEIEEFARNFGITGDKFASGFVEVILREIDFNLYLQGKYVLPEDL